MLDTALEETRSLTFELSPPILYELGLGSAIESLAEQVQRRHGLQVRVRNSMGADEPPLELRVLLFQATRELIVNVVKHADARSALVTLQHGRGNDSRRLRIEIKDNGQGFLPADLASGRAGFGLFNLRTRLEQVGGTLHLQSAPGKGTRAIVTAPLNASASAAVNLPR